MTDSSPRDPVSHGQGARPSHSSVLIHWIKLVSTAIVGLAALAGAIAVIIDLLDEDPVPAVTAEFKPLEVTPTTLDQFQAMQKFISSGLPPARVRLVAATTEVAQESSGEDVDNGTTNDEPQPCPSPPEVDGGAVVPEGCPGAGQPCPTASEVADLGAEVPEGCPAPGLDCPTSTEVGQGVRAPQGCPVDGLLENSNTGSPEETTEQLDNQYDMGRGCSGNPAGSRCALADVAASTGTSPDGSPASRLKSVRKVLAGTRTRLGQDGKRLPMGIMVSLDVTVTGMSGQRLKVYWSMISASTKRALGQSWLRNTQAATLRPSAATDQLQTDLWLPLPREQGRYRARVTLIDEDDRHFSKRSDIFH